MSDDLRARLIEALRNADALHHGGPQYDLAGNPVDYEHLADAVLALPIAAGLGLQWGCRTPRGAEFGPFEHADALDFLRGYPTADLIVRTGPGPWMECAYPTAAELLGIADPGFTAAAARRELQAHEEARPDDEQVP